MSEPQPPRGTETNAEHQPASAGLESLAAVGARLAQLREAKGWSVADVSSRLKVAAPKLRALEAGDISQMPGATFAAGVVRSYAKMLGVDPEPFAQALRREKGVPEVDLSMPASAGTGLPRGRVSIPLGAPTRGRTWLWGVLAVIVVLIAAAMWHSSGDSANWLARFKSNTGATSPVASEAGQASSVAAQAAATSDTTAIAVGGSTVTGGVASDAGASAGGSAPATDDAGASAAAPAQPGSSAAASSADGASVVAAAGQSVLGITVKQDCWVSVRDKSGKELVSALVKAGETRQVAGDTPLRVTIGNRAGLESVTFDGKIVDPAKYSAGKGNVARFALP